MTAPPSRLLRVGEALTLCLVLLFLLAAGCHSRTVGEKSAGIADGATPPAGPLFQEITSEAGILPRVRSWPDGKAFMPEINPGGVALLDYDNDGRLDILQTCHSSPSDPTAPAPKRLYHQNPNGTFSLVPGAAGLDDVGFGQGVAVGDYDNDGFPDVYFCNFGLDSLYRNNGDGTFTNVTLKAGISTQAGWSSAAAFFDYDRDGWLDLIVVHYVQYDPSIVCEENSHRVYCGPQHYDGSRVTLYHNNGDGTFSDVTQRAGLTLPGKGLGVACADLTGDGWPDIFITNDGEANGLWVNQHDGTFKNEAYLRGCALNGMGQSEANMGVAIGDANGSGVLSVFTTHQSNEKNTLFLANSAHTFRDASADAGMALTDLPFTGWGTGFIDIDNSGRLGLAVVNGRIRSMPPQPGADCGAYWNGFAERNLLFENDGTGHFRDLTASAGDFTKHAEVTRGLAFGDIDNDGRTDMVSNTIDNTLRIYRNVAQSTGNHWLTIRALTGRRDALGARIWLDAGGRKLVRLALAGYSSGCSSDPRVHFGLGTAVPTTVNVEWPDGTWEQFQIAGVDRLISVREGEGTGMPAVK